jgi:hypothetical protein
MAGWRLRNSGSLPGNQQVPKPSLVASRTLPSNRASSPATRFAITQALSSMSCAACRISLPAAVIS